MCQGYQCISGSSPENVQRVYKEKTELSHHHLRKKLQKPRLLRIHLNKHHQVEVRSLCPTGVRAQANHLHSRTSVWSSYLSGVLYTCAPLYCSGTCEKTCEKHRNTCEKLFEKICIRLRLLRKMRQPKIRLVALPPNASKRPRTRNRMQKESRRGRAGAAVSVFSA